MELEKMLERRNKALLELDMDYARQMMPGTSDEVRRLAMHKARYECTALPREVRHQSGEWLRAGGYRRLTGDELLPEGALPE